MDSFRLLAVVAVLGGASTGCSSSNGSADGGIVGRDAGATSQSSSGGGDSDGSIADGGCPTAQTCGSQCCDGAEVCAKDASGNPFCGRACVGGAECPMESSCCDPGPTGGKGGVCMPDIGQQCLCTKTIDCTSNACAPAVDTSGNPTGPYVCVPNDGAPYTGCHGLMTCGPPYCCVTDSNGNQFCATQCTADSTCGAGHCDTFDFSASSCTGGSKACGI